MKAAPNLQMEMYILGKHWLAVSSFAEASASVPWVDFSVSVSERREFELVSSESRVADFYSPPPISELPRPVLAVPGGWVAHDAGVTGFRQMVYH